MTIIQNAHQRIGRMFVVAVAVTAVTIACRADAILSVSASALNSRVDASVGDEVDIKLGTIGPGAFDGSPTISSPAVGFIDVSYVDINPGGPVQLFRFKGLAKGTATIVFHRVGVSFISPGDTVRDTVVVR